MKKKTKFNRLTCMEGGKSFFCFKIMLVAFEGQHYQQHLSVKKRNQ